MKILRAPCWIAASVLVAASSLWASEDYPVEVSQPAGDWIITTTYFTNLSGYPVEVDFTTAPNTVARFGGTWNANAASERGLHVSVVPGAKHPAVQTYEDVRGLGMRGDTVDVVLDLTHASPAPIPPACDDLSLMTRVMQTVFDGLVEQTLSCILLNARRRWPEVRFVSLDVTGADQYSRFKGVYPLATVPQLGEASRWSAAYLVRP